MLVAGWGLMSKKTTKKDSPGVRPGGVVMTNPPREDGVRAPRATKAKRKARIRVALPAPPLSRARVASTRVERFMSRSPFLAGGDPPRRTSRGDPATLPATLERLKAPLRQCAFSGGITPRIISFSGGLAVRPVAADFPEQPDAGGSDDYPSASEADAAYCGIVGWWVRWDASRIKRIWLSIAPSTRQGPRT
jgi:hypothetical protein